MLRQCRMITKTIEPFDRLRESERAPEIRRPFFWLLKNSLELAGSPQAWSLDPAVAEAEKAKPRRIYVKIA